MLALQIADRGYVLKQAALILVTSITPANDERVKRLI